MNEDAVSYSIGDLVKVELNRPHDKAGEQKEIPIFAYDCLETFVSSSHPGNTFAYDGDIGIVVEMPNILDLGTGKILGVLFHDKKKYLSCSKLQLIRKAAL